MKYCLLIFLVASLFFSFIPAGSTALSNLPIANPDPSFERPLAQQIYLPLVVKPFAQTILNSAPRVNIPFFQDGVKPQQSAILWFGQVNAQDNYADVRLGYSSDELYVNLVIFDRLTWYDPHPTADDLTAWDTVVLYLNLNGNTGGLPGTAAYRFEGQLSWFEARADYQAAYRGNGSSWAPAPIPFTTDAYWRGDSPNNSIDDRGWGIVFHIPFDSLGLTGAPGEGTIWGLAFDLHDRDDGEGTAIPVQAWPKNMEPELPQTWGQLFFGLPVYTPPPAGSGGTAIIRQGQNGASVADGMVGGGTTCGDGLDFWNEWGKTNYAGADQVNVQNQLNVDDWPCFSKFFITFPLDSLPAGKAILSAKLTLFQFGNSKPDEARRSLIQILAIDEDWSESTITWNNAPLAGENVSQAWVDVLAAFPGWPGVPREWDVSRAVAQAYQDRSVLRLALYSSDGSMHSGKYFYTSEADLAGRPVLEVSWGEPSP